MVISFSTDLPSIYNCQRTTSQSDFNLLVDDGDERSRTAGLLVANQTLSQLSYTPDNDKYITIKFEHCQILFEKEYNFTTEFEQCQIYFQ